MKHYGDICKMQGANIEPVDIVTGGSPCQDLSVAGKRAGLDGERSGLFMEQIRVVKEMRNADRFRGRTNELIRPRYMVWENVPGAFSSNNGKDFQAVLTEIVRIVEPDAPDFPIPDKGGWQHSGGLYGVGADGQPFSVAWRLHDAQYHGVPQRRKRLCVLADFNGLTAPWILFDPQYERASESGEPLETERDITDERRAEIQPLTESVSGDSEQSGTQGEGSADGTESGIGGAGESQSADSAICIQGNTIDRSDTAGANGAGWHRGGVTPLTPLTDPQLSTLTKLYDVRISSVGTKNQRAHCYETDISRCLDTGGENPDSNHGGVSIVSSEHQLVETEPILLESNQNHATVQTNGVSTALPAAMGEGGGYVPMITYGIDRVMLSGGTTYQGRGYYDEVSGCLKTQPHGVAEINKSLS